MKDLIEGVQRFQSRIYPSHRELFEHLAHGQSPEVLFITCADSRVDPSMLTQTPPGKLFVMRNAGNLVPAWSAEGGGEAATIAYAVENLAVHHIVVCGHSSCGAVTAALSGHTGDVIGQWLENAGPLAEVVSTQWPDLVGADRVHAGVHLNAHAQLAKLRTHPNVAKAEAEGRLTLHVWVYDIGTGGVVAYVPSKHVFLPLAQAQEEAALLQELEREEPPVEEGWVDHGPWTATLVSLGGQPNAVSDAIRQITNWPVHDVHQVLSRLPAPILGGLTEMEARVLAAWVEDAGGAIELHRS